MTTKRQDAASIVGDTYAAKLDEYERKLRKKERYKSAVEPGLILKSNARSRVLALVEKANIVLTLKSAIERADEQVEDIVRGYGNWHEKERKLKLVVRALIEDVDKLHLLGDDRVRKALHRRVNRIKKYAQRVHTECLLEELINAQREVAAITADVRMRRVLGLR